jgi:hypothetical protein
MYKIKNNNISGYNAVVHQLSPPLNYVFQDYTTECDMGHARLRTHLAASDHMSVSREFASAVCELPVNYQLPNYMKLIEEWGTVSKDSRRLIPGTIWMLLSNDVFITYFALERLI